MHATAKGSFGSAIASWMPPSHRSRSPTSPHRPSYGSRSTSPSAHRATSPDRAASPGGRSFGADSYSVDYLKKQSLSINTDAKDVDTQCLRCIANECNARCTVVANGLVWMGERDGGISIRKVDGDLKHIIERRKGAFVWSMCEVGGSVWAGCSDGFIRVLSQQTYKLEHQFAKHAGGGGGVHCLAYHPPSNTVFSGSNDWEILAWDATTYQVLRQIPGHSGAVRALLVDRNTLFSASDDGCVAAWNIPNAQKIHHWTGHTKGVHTLCVTDQHLWSGSEDATIRIWNPNTGECLGIAEVHTGPVQALATVGDKVWSGAGDTVCVWDAVRLKLLGTYVNHDGYLTTIVITQKVAQYRVWTTSTDNTVKLWNTEAADDAPGLRRRLLAADTVQQDNDQLREANAKLQELIQQLQEAVVIKDQQVEGAAAQLALTESGKDAATAETLRLREMQIDADRQVTEVHATHAAVVGELAAAKAEIETLRANLMLEHNRAQPVMDVDRIAQLTDENNLLRMELQACREEAAVCRGERDRTLVELDRAAHTLQSSSVSYEVSMREMQDTLAGAGARARCDLTEAATAYEIQLRDVQLALADAQVRHAQEISEVSSVFEAQLTDVHKQLADSQTRESKLTSQNREMVEEATRLTNELHNALLEVEHLNTKVRDMDIMFKSRLSLITDIYKGFRRLETCDKRLRAQELSTTVSHFRSIIGLHFTDDELAHLGSSRHFFPGPSTSDAPSGRTTGSSGPSSITSPRLVKPPRRGSHHQG